MLARIPQSQVTDMNLDETHDPNARTWLDDANEHPDFPPQNLPFGVFSTASTPRRGGIAIGPYVLDITKLSPLLDGDALRAAQAMSQPTLNALLSLGCVPRRALRRAVFKLLTDRTHEAGVREALTPIDACQLHLPADVGDYTDFYAGIHHAMNVGKQFRPDAPLLPNYKYVPIGYHGRSSSLEVSGAQVVRPRGQLKGPNDAAPTFAATQRLDYELEVGIWIGGSNERGAPIPINAAHEYVAGLCLLNDWSARDIQAWEYQPLGPFLAKNFQTSVSPWIITTEALAPYRVAQPPRASSDPAPLPYLMDAGDQASGAFDITLEVHLRTQLMRETNTAAHRLSRGNLQSLYWTAAQLVTHHTCNGCNLRPGDLLGTGTISGTEPTSFGSLLELSQGGKTPLELPNGERRSFLLDGDELTLTAYAQAPGRVRIGFGACVGVVAH